MLRIIGTLIATAMVQFRVSPRDRARGKAVHSGANLITKYECQIQAKSFHPVHVRTIRVYAKVGTNGWNADLHYSTVDSYEASLHNALPLLPY